MGMVKKGLEEQGIGDGPRRWQDLDLMVWEDAPGRGPEGHHKTMWFSLTKLKGGKEEVKFVESWWVQGGM